MIHVQAFDKMNILFVKLDCVLCWLHEIIRTKRICLHQMQSVAVCNPQTLGLSNESKHECNVSDLMLGYGSLNPVLGDISP